VGTSDVQVGKVGGVGFVAVEIAFVGGSAGGGGNRGEQMRGGGGDCAANEKVID
jgi:hypothetical protein